MEVVVKGLENMDLLDEQKQEQKQEVEEVAEAAEPPSEDRHPLNNSGYYLIFEKYTSLEQVKQLLALIRAQAQFTDVDFTSVEEKSDQIFALPREQRAILRLLRLLEQSIQDQGLEIKVYIHYEAIAKFFIGNISTNGTIFERLKELSAFLQQNEIQVISGFTRCAEDRRWAIVWIPKKEEKTMLALFTQPLPDELKNVSVTHAHSRPKRARMRFQSAQSARPYPVRRERGGRGQRRGQGRSRGRSGRNRRNGGNQKQYY